MLLGAFLGLLLFLLFFLLFLKRSAQQEGKLALAQRRAALMLNLKARLWSNVALIGLLPGLYLALASFPRWLIPIVSLYLLMVFGLLGLVHVLLRRRMRQLALPAGYIEGMMAARQYLYLAFMALVFSLTVPIWLSQI